MSQVQCLVKCLLLSIALLAMRPALAADAAEARWACWYSPSDLHVRCLLIHAPTDDAMERSADVARVADPRLSALVHQIWGNPAELAGHQIRIPLWNVPYEMSFARELAESVMCGVRLDCSVIFDVNADGLAQVRAAALAAGAAEDVVLAEVRAQGFIIAAASEDTAASEAAVEAPARTSRRRRFFDS